MHQQPDFSSAGAPRQTTSREFLAVLFRRGPLILGLFFVTTATVLALAFTTPVEYVSSGRVLVKRGEKESTLTPGRRLYSEWEEDMGSEVEVVKSGDVIESARELLRREAGAGRSAPKLEAGQVDVEVKGRTNVVLIGYADRDPIVARTVCDAIVRAYMEFRQNDFSLSTRPNFFEDELKQVQSELDHWVNVRRNYATRSNVIDLPVQRSMEIAQLGTLQHRRNDLESDAAAAELAYRKIQDLQRNQNFDQPSFASDFGDESALVELKRKMVEQQFRVASLRERLREDAPEMAAAVATLDTLQAMLRREVESRAAVLGARHELVQARLRTVDQQIAQLERVLASMPDKEVSMSDMNHRIEILKERYRELSEDRNKAVVTANTTSNKSLVLLARAGAAVPRNARDYVRLALAPAFSLVIGIGLAFFIDGIDLTVRTARHAEEAAEVPVLATLVERRRRRRLAEGVAS